MTENANRKSNITAYEIERVSALSKYENELYEQGYTIIAGVDEVGRGPLAGPVLACAVILPRDCFIPYINDSKKLTSKKREILFDEINKAAIDIGYGLVGSAVIDKINILQATWLAMCEAVKSLSVKVEMTLVDGHPVQGIAPQKSIIGGDRKSISIAAAGIMAKVTRDRLMIEYDAKYPVYGFAKHKGYGTKEHIDAIGKFGVCEIHRLSFSPCKNK